MTALVQATLREKPSSGADRAGRGPAAGLCPEGSIAGGLEPSAGSSSIPAMSELRIEAHFGDLVLARALARLQRDRIALFAADDGAGDGRRDGDAALFDVRLVVPDDAV